MLITWYLYNKHNDIDPGELTDLRSASVNNENFAYAAVRRNLHLHLQHRSGYLQSQIADYVKFVATSSTDTNSLQTKKSPKVCLELSMFLSCISFINWTEDEAKWAGPMG